MGKRAADKLAGATPASAILASLSAFLLKLRSIGLCAKEVVPHAKKLQDEALTHSKHQMELAGLALVSAIERVKSETPSSVQVALSDISLRLRRNHEEITLHSATQHDVLLRNSLLMYLFSTFDAFVSEVLYHLFEFRTEVLRASEKSFSLAEILEFSSYEDGLEQIIEAEIDSLVRHSYPDMFSKIAKRFGLATLTKFDNWKRFVECSERRHVITHCGGRVNGQYKTRCTQAGLDVSVLSLGFRLPVDEEYLRGTQNVLYEVGFKLAHTLIHKSIPEERALSDREINTEIVNVLIREEWCLAKILADFAVHMPSHATDLLRRLKIINCAQTLRWNGDLGGMKTVLNKEDWSGTTRDCRLAVAVLFDRYDEAAELMTSIGRQGEQIDEQGYLAWPIFREFRKTEQFASAFQSVFGRSFGNAVVEEKLEGNSEAGSTNDEPT